MFTEDLVFVYVLLYLHVLHHKIRAHKHPLLLGLSKIIHAKPWTIIIVHGFAFSRKPV